MYLRPPARGYSTLTLKTAHVLINTVEG